MRAMYASVAASTLKLAEGWASGGTVVTEGISLAALLPFAGADCAAAMPKPRQKTRQKTRRNKAQFARMPEIIGKGTSCEFNRSIYGRAQWLVSREWRGIRMGLRPTHRNEKPFFVCHPERRIRSPWRPHRSRRNPMVASHRGLVVVPGGGDLAFSQV